MAPTGSTTIKPSNRFARFPTPTMDQLLKDLQDYDAEMSKKIADLSARITALGG